MSKKKYVLSTCGLNTLYQVSATNAEKKYITQYANAKGREDIDAKHLEVLDSLLMRVEERLTKADYLQVMRLSPELNGLLRFYDLQLEQDARADYQQMICFDSWLGEQLCVIFKEWFEIRGCNAGVLRVRNLQPGEHDNFKVALSELVSWCDETLVSCRETHQVIFNLTGGFPSLQGALQTIATFYADETIYLFETGHELLRIPRLPVKMAGRPLVEPCLMTLRQLRAGLPVEAVKLAELPAELLWSVEGQQALSVWGELIWKYTYKSLYREKLHGSPSPRVRISPSLQADANMFEEEVLYAVNKKVDDLSQLWEHQSELGGAYALEFQEIWGHPGRVSTHECRLSALRTGEKIWLHAEADCLVLDKLCKSSR